MTINIPALFGAVAAKVNTVFSTRLSDPFTVYYDFGRYLEITNRLVEKGKAIVGKNQRYPLIWLVIPFREIYGDSNGYCDLTDVQIIIAMPTEPTSTTPDRIAENYVPRLYPIYEELLKQIRISGFFSEIADEIQHIKIDQPYWDGKENGNSAANMFNDFIDAIQLKNIRLTVNETTCLRFRLIGQAA